MKIALQKAPRLHKGIPWTACEPFVENTRATLIHRVRHVTTHKIGDRWKAHLAVHAWCGTSFTGTKKFTFLSEPPAGKLVCARCEEMATKRNMETSDAIAGRHVHLGRTIAVATCCADVAAQGEGNG